MSRRTAIERPGRRQFNVVRDGCSLTSCRDAQFNVMSGRRATGSFRPEPERRSPKARGSLTSCPGQLQFT
eukprot:9696011-Alexandrium_andersonii.AAC.1